MPPRRPNVSVIGAGTVGTVLTLALHEQQYPVVSVISRTGRKAVALARAAGCSRASTQISDIDPRTELLLIAVSDSALPGIVREVASNTRHKFRKFTVLHCSGAYPAGILAPLKKKKAVIASLHPIQTFPATQSPAKLLSKLRGIFYGIDGEGDGLRRAQDIVSHLGGKSVVIPAPMRPLYHVACVFASNYLIVYLDAISQISRTIGIDQSWTDVFGPLMTRTMENVIRDTSASALTGPIVRGDFQTVKVHLESLEKFAPQFIPFYTMNGIELARIARRNDRITPETFGTLLKIFQSSIATTPKIKVKR